MPRHADHATGATTRAATAVRAKQAHRLLPPHRVLASPHSGLAYRVGALLGQGGFGQVYLATRLGRSDTVPATVCIKVSPHIEGWVREAYFGQLLGEHPRAIRVFDAFALLDAGGRTLYALAIEYASEGDLSAFLNRTGRKWAEGTVRREIAGILQVLGKLHRGQLLHRDLTPVNVFVCQGRRLKLGDFGIVRSQTDHRGVTVHTLNPHMAPSDIVDGAAPKWQARDDVYQVGQLIGMLVKGSAHARIRRQEVRAFDCSDHLKEVIYRCLAERSKRYESATELIEALSNPPAPLKAGQLRTLRGAHVAFTGILSVTRAVAATAARKAGATVHAGPSARTTVVVRGRPNKLQAAGRDAGRKLMEIKRLREKGHRIVILDESQFWRLAGRRPRR